MLRCVATELTAGFDAGVGLATGTTGFDVLPPPPPHAVKSIASAAEPSAYVNVFTRRVTRMKERWPHKAEACWKILA
jgi:hypothetical protein